MGTKGYNQRGRRCELWAQLLYLLLIERPALNVVPIGMGL